MQDETEVSEAAKADYGHIISDAPKGEMVKTGGTDVARLLEPGERVVWELHIGTEPSDDLSRQRGGWILIILGVVLALFCLKMETDSSFVAALIALVCLSGPGIIFILMPKTTDSTNYWLTNRHAIIRMKQGGASGYTTTMIELATTDAVKMVERGDGRGTIVFGRNAVSTYSPAARGYVSNEADYSFSDIPNVTEVYRLVQQMQREARQGEV